MLALMNWCFDCKGSRAGFPFCTIMRLNVLVALLGTALISQKANAQYGFIDGGFDSQAAAVTSFCYLPDCPGGAWNGSSSGLIRSGDLTWGGTKAYAANGMAFIQNGGVIRQTFTATETRRVRLVWWEADRPQLGGQSYVVSVNGVQIATYTASTTSFRQRLSEPFELIAGSAYTITFAGQGNGDKSGFIDSIRLVAEDATGNGTQFGFKDGSFDVQGKTVATYCYFPSCPAGAWSGNSVLVHDSDPSWSGPVAPTPSAYAAVQQDRSLQQLFTATASGRVRLAWLEADRPVLGGQTYNVTVNGVTVATFTSSTMAFQPRMSAAFNLEAGVQYTVIFRGQSGEVDRSSFIDKIRLVTDGSTVTYKYDALGRLIATSTSGGTADNANAIYTLDPANNRTRVTVDGAPR